MNILEEAKKILTTLSHWLVLFLVVAGVFFATDISTNIFQRVRTDLLPEGVQLVVTNPTSAFVAQIVLSLSLAFIITFPFFLYKVMSYLSPALFQHEKKMIFRALLPSVALFFGGCVFAYRLLIPATFKILYPYTTAIGAVPFFSLEEFLSSIFSLMIVTGVMFLLPIFMILGSFLGLVEGGFWWANLRYVCLFFLVFTAIITPDGTGVTMLILFVPLLTLYLLGCLLTRKFRDRSI